MKVAICSCRFDDYDRSNNDINCGVDHSRFENIVFRYLEVATHIVAKLDFHINKGLLKWA